MRSRHPLAASTRTLALAFVCASSSANEGEMNGGGSGALSQPGALLEAATAAAATTATTTVTTTPDALTFYPRVRAASERANASEKYSALARRVLSLFVGSCAAGERASGRRAHRDCRRRRPHATRVKIAACMGKSVKRSYGDSAARTRRLAYNKQAADKADFY